MTRIIWKKIREEVSLALQAFFRLDDLADSSSCPTFDWTSSTTTLDWSIVTRCIAVRPYLLRCADPGQTNDAVTVEAAKAIQRYKVGVKCATITPDEARVKEFKLKEMWKSPNGTVRDGLDLTTLADTPTPRSVTSSAGPSFASPSSRVEFPSLYRGGRNPSSSVVTLSVTRWVSCCSLGFISWNHVVQYRATDFVAPGPGKLQLVYTPGDQSPSTVLDVYDFEGPGVAMAMYNTDEVRRAIQRRRRMLRGHT